jgi:hypothetical protein
MDVCGLRRVNHPRAELGRVLLCRPGNTSKPTTLPSHPRCRPYESGTKPGAFHSEARICCSLVRWVERNRSILAVVESPAS